jgi:uncharacterized protein YjbI with pentapeptide repeats
LRRFGEQVPALPGHPPRAEMPSAAPSRTRRRWVALGAAATVLLVIAALLLPRILLDWDLAGASTPDRASAVNDIRTGLLQALGGLAVLGGATLTWRQLQVSRSAQVTDAFGTAITQLGDANLDVRLGGIYALERIARTSPGDRQAIEEVLAHFVRNRTEHATTRATDVNTALLVLGRRSPTGGILALDRARLHDVRLRYARLVGADLHYANLDGANLFGADLSDADLTGASLRSTVLVEASLHRADLRDAVLTGAVAGHLDLRAADLSRADLSNAYLDHAWLNQADLRATDLTGATLSNADLTGAVVDDDTRWPAGYTPTGVVRRPDIPIRPRYYPTG